MQIYTNVNSINTVRQLDRNQSTLATSFQRLSSGLRINAAKDDAAALAISERMGSQIRGNGQAVRNANDGISLLQIADGALGSAVEMMQRVRELAVQSANGTNSVTDRHALQAEASQLLNELGRLGKETQFNGTRLFVQQTSDGADPTKRSIRDGLRVGWLSAAESLITEHFGITGQGDKLFVGFTMGPSAPPSGPGGVAAYVQRPPDQPGYDQEMRLDMADFTPPNLPNGGSAPYYNDRIIVHEMVHAVMNSAFGARTNAMPLWFLEGMAELIHGADDRVKIDLAAAGGDVSQVVNAIAGGGWATDSLHYSSAFVAARRLHDTLKTSGGIKGLMTYLAKNTGASLDDAINALTNGTYASASAFLDSFTGASVATGVAYFNAQINLNDADTGGIGGLNADGGALRTAESTVPFGGSRGFDSSRLLEGFRVTIEDIGGSIGQRSISLRVGANPDEDMDVSIGALGIGALGLDDIDIGSEHGASIAMVRLDEALQAVNLQRGNIGGKLSRLDFAIANLQATIETSSASRSRIRDADFAQETATLTRNQILQQSATAMLASANAMPRQVLGLLRGLR